MNIYKLTRTDTVMNGHYLTVGVIAVDPQQARILAAEHARRIGGDYLAWVSCLDSDCELIDTGVPEYRIATVLWATFAEEKSDAE